SLVRILPQWTLPKSTMQAAYLPRSSQIPAIRALIDFLVEALQRPSGETGPAYRRAVAVDRLNGAAHSRARR
ncbi:hypothetical protein ACV35V_34640, partial [Pseudomonas aeruginosa]